MSRLSFRKGRKATGLASIAAPNAETYINLNGAVVGQIDAPGRFGEDVWRPAFMVSDEGGGWRWARMRATFASEPEARAWVKANFAAIVERYSLSPQEDWKPWEA